MYSAETLIGQIERGVVAPSRAGVEAGIARNKRNQISLRPSRASICGNRQNAECFRDGDVVRVERTDTDGVMGRAENLSEVASDCLGAEAGRHSCFADHVPRSRAV